MNTFRTGDHVVQIGPHTYDGMTYHESPNGVGSTAVVDALNGDGSVHVKWDDTPQRRGRTSNINESCLAPMDDDGMPS